MATSFSESGLEISGNVKYLDTIQLEELEHAFRDWAAKPKREDIRISRARVLMVFLLIRYTGAKLGEVLDLDETRSIDMENEQVTLSRADSSTSRQVPLPGNVVKEFGALLADPRFAAYKRRLFTMDQAHVRKKFYERAGECNLPKEMCSPEVIRRSRGIELLSGGMPLPVVQRVLGHSTPALAAEYLNLPPEDVQKVTRHFMERESKRKTSARNAFYGKVVEVSPGDIQSCIKVESLGGHEVAAVITNSSLRRLRLKVGAFVTAEIKAPWVLVAKDRVAAAHHAGNLFEGVVRHTERGRISSEIIVQLTDGTDICAVVTEESRQKLALQEGDKAWVHFSELAVILNVD